MRNCLKNEADVELQHGEGDQPIHIAAEKGNNEYVDVLKEHSLDWTFAITIILILH